MPPLDDALVYCHRRTKQQRPYRRTHTNRAEHDEHLNDAPRCYGIAYTVRLGWARTKDQVRVKRRRYICLFRISWSNLYLNKQAKCITNIWTSEFVECLLCHRPRRHHRCCWLIVNCDGKRSNERINKYVVDVCLCVFKLLLTKIARLSLHTHHTFATTSDRCLSQRPNQKIELERISKLFYPNTANTQHIHARTTNSSVFRACKILMWKSINVFRIEW